MKELPILFNGEKVKPLKFNEEMEQAALDGRKTVTRRPIKPAPTDEEVRVWRFEWAQGEATGLEILQSLFRPEFTCPYGEVGDRFFIRGVEFKITARRIERVQEISEEDMKAEGVISGSERTGVKSQCHSMGYKWSFMRLWNSIYEKKGFGFDTNCWVWVIEFRRTK